LTTTYVNWGESNVKLTWEKNNLLPPDHLITSVHGFCFQEDPLLLVDVNHRGWDFPGGHIEPGESPEDCFKREAQEEGYVEGKYESAQRMFVNPNDMASYYHNWNILYKEIVDCAIQ